MGGTGVDTEAFRSAMRVLAAGVVMVTVRVEGRPWGLTVSACCSLSAEPPQILVSLGRHTRSRREIVETGAFGVSILRAGQKPIAQAGAQAGAPKWIDGCSEGGALAGLRSPMVAGALCHLDCAIDTAFELADHTLVVGLVERVVPGQPAGEDESGPLLYFDRAFRRIGCAID